jgi:hypothetical protein
MIIVRRPSNSNGFPSDQKSRILFRANDCATHFEVYVDYVFHFQKKIAWIFDSP